MNWEELGFRSQKEMEESIERVKAAKKNPKNDLELRAANKAKFDAMNKNNGIDLKGLEEGARLEELDRVVASKLYWEREAEKQKAEQEAIQDIMSGLSEQVEAEDKKKAEAELRKAEAEQKEKLQKEIYNKHGVKTDKEAETDQLLGNMLKGLKL